MGKAVFKPEIIINNLVNAYPLDDTKIQIYNAAYQRIHKERSSVIDVLLAQASKNQLIEIIKHLEKHDNIAIDTNNDDE